MNLDAEYLSIATIVYPIQVNLFRMLLSTGEFNINLNANSVHASFGCNYSRLLFYIFFFLLQNNKLHNNQIKFPSDRYFAG